jgi:hypothetical protein
MKNTRLLAGAALVALGPLSSLLGTPHTRALSTIDAAAHGQPGATGCADIGDTTPAVDGFPGRMSSLLGADIRTGGHPCFERVVLELQGSGELPGYRVAYEDDPILESPSGTPVDIAGAATLVLSVGAWMTDVDGNGYQGPAQVFPDNVVNIAELRLIENFEGQHAWAIGVDSERGFAVTTLGDPVRIVIDIELDPAAPSPAPTSTVTPAPTPPTLPATR